MPSAQRSPHEERSPRGISIFSIPKTFEGHFNVIQRNAIESWTKMTPTPEITLLGDDPGVGELCEELDIRHVPQIELTAGGTPRVDDIFRVGEATSTGEVLAYVNSDIILLDDFPSAVAAVDRPRFLLIGRRWGLDISGPISFKEGWQAQLRSEVLSRGRQAGPTGLDYFVFSRGLFPSLPPFGIGRTAWDNYIVYAAHKQRADLIDASDAVLAIHQDHGYDHVAGGTAAVWKGPEAERNVLLAGGVNRVWDVRDADFRIQGGNLRRVPASARLRRKIARQKGAALSRGASIKRRLKRATSN